jgi:Tol biopolymer transport system component
MRALRILGPAVLAAFASASTCDSNVGDGDERARETVRMSVRATGEGGTAACQNPSISSDGRYVVFESTAEDLVIPDGNGYGDIFLKDRATGALENVTRVSPSLLLGAIPFTTYLSHALTPAVSRDGRYVAFRSKGSFQGPLSLPSAPLLPMQVFVHDRALGTFRAAVDPTLGYANEDCDDLTMSDDGRYVAFVSRATNLGYANPTFLPQVYVADMAASPAAITLVSRGASATEIAGTGASLPRMSRDGRFVVFLSDAPNLGVSGLGDRVYLGTSSGDPVEHITVVPGGASATGTFTHPTVSGDGRYVAFYALASDLSPAPSLSTTLLRYDRGGSPPSAALIAGDPFIQDGAGPPVFPGGDVFSISGDGRFVAYAGQGTPAQIHVRDMEAPGRFPVSLSSAGVPGDFHSRRPMLSGDGRWVVWQSDASNLSQGDVNLVRDVFLHGPLR